MTNPRNGSYAITPSFVLDDETLDEGAKVLYGRISMYSEEGRCWASNQHFADKHKVTTRCIQQWLEQLKDAGYIEIDLDKSGFQTKRDIWIINDFKKQFTRRNTVRADANCISSGGAPQFTSSNKTNTSTQIQEQQQQESVVVSSEKLKQQQLFKRMKSLGLSDKTIEKAFQQPWPDIENAIECCLNAPKSIDNVDGYFATALHEKWQPRPSKEKITKTGEETKKKEQQLQQKLYSEASALYLANYYKLKDGFDIHLSDNSLQFLENGRWATDSINENSIKYLKKYIKDHSK